MPLHNRVSGHDWRSALAGFHAIAARERVTLHAAQLLLAHGLNGEAETALWELLGRFPEDLQALKLQGMILRRGGREGEAVEVFARAARVEAGLIAVAPGDCGKVAQFFEAANRGGQPPTAAPVAYLRSIFDENADQYDTHLRRTLSYRAPELLFAAISGVAGAKLQNLDVLDLGCGTGLAGELFRSVSRRLDGVDLSTKMLALAAAKGLYDRLDSGELVEHLDGIDHRYHLILAADVFVYLGDLVPVFTAARRALQDGGWLAFTVETGAGDDYYLQNVRRYAHPRSYLARVAGACGYEVLYSEESSVRFESQQPVRSFVCVWGKLGAFDA